jgi:dTDP-4-amino-4,6-dideoxygalactose transaminase
MLSKLNDLQAHNSHFEDELRAAADRVFKSGWFALGPEVEAFEAEFAAYCGAHHCIGVANGTDALELALRGVGVERGDEVITAANAGMYATHAILAIGATPVYADVVAGGHGLDPESVSSRIAHSTRALVTTHLFGRMADIGALRSVADRAGIALVEDCAQAHGASAEGVRAGAWGDASAFSFYPTKNLGALGDAGAVVTSSRSTAERVRRLRQYGWSPKYVSKLGGGRNSRLDELQAAFLRVKLPELDRLSRERRAIASAWAGGLAHEAIALPDVAGDDFVAHLFVVVAEWRDDLRRFLAEHGIASEVHYPLLDCQQPGFGGPDVTGQLPESERLRSRVLTLPCYPELCLGEIDRACDRINRWNPG